MYKDSDPMRFVAKARFRNFRTIIIEILIFFDSYDVLECFRKKNVKFWEYILFVNKLWMHKHTFSLNEYSHLIGSESLYIPHSQVS